MKTNKIYIPFRLGLFIGLLTFHTLSSCVGTKRTLGMNREENETFDEALLRLMKAHEELKKDALFKPVPWYHKLHHPPALLIGSTCLFLTGMTAWYFLFNTSSENSSLPAGVSIGGTMETALQTNGTLPLQRLEPALIDYVNTTVGPIVNSTVTSIVNATKIAGTLATTVLPTAGLIAALRSNSSNVAYNTHQNATQRFMPSDSHTPSIEKNGSMEPYNAKPNRLSKEFIDYILANNLKNFSVPTMQYWIRKDPSIVNARNPDSETLLMFAVKKDKFDVVECLVENGADVNLPDRDQNTAIRHVDGRNPNAKRIYDYLLEHGADPCIKNVKNRRLDDVDGIASFGTPKLLDALKKCPK